MQCKLRIVSAFPTAYLISFTYESMRLVLIKIIKLELKLLQCWDNQTAVEIQTSSSLIFHKTIGYFPRKVSADPPCIKKVQKIILLWMKKINLQKNDNV